MKIETGFFAKKIFEEKDFCPAKSGDAKICREIKKSKGRTSPGCPALEMDHDYVCRSRLR
jgi:hypothetical protein